MTRQIYMTEDELVNFMYTLVDGGFLLTSGITKFEGGYVQRIEQEGNSAEPVLYKIYLEGSLEDAIKKEKYE